MTKISENLIKAQELLVDIITRINDETPNNLEDLGDLREEYGILDAQLKDSEKQILKRLGGALYMLSDDEIFYNQPKDKNLTLEKLSSLLNFNDCVEVLEELRLDYKYVPTWLRAYLRGRAYGIMGLKSASEAFFSIADEFIKKSYSDGLTTQSGFGDV